ncbi:MAG: efflux RND transporter periplasmic adaptor subunit [Thermacetogeniaceae bacterium]
MENRWKWVILTLLISLLGFGIAGCSGRGAERVAVGAVPARSGQIAKAVVISGVLTPNQSVSIFSKVSGQAQTVGAEVGDRVRAGQLLVQIDTKELNAQLQQAQAAVQAVRDQAGQAEIGIANAKSNLDMGQKSYDRTKMLFDNGAASQSQLDDAQNKLDQANNAYANANKQYQTASGSGLAQAEAAANLLQVEIGNGRIASPIDGIISNRSIDPGGMASPSAPLMTVDDTSALKLQGSVFQDAVPLLAIGQKVPVSVDALPGRSFEGQITQVGPVASATGQYFPVVISLQNPGILLAGMTARATFNLAAPAGVIVPLSAVQSEDGRDYVYVVDGGSAHRRQVALGLRGASDVQVVSGVQVGERVATSNVSMLWDSMAVTEATASKI